MKTKQINIEKIIERINYLTDEKEEIRKISDDWERAWSYGYSSAMNRIKEMLIEQINK